MPQQTIFALKLAVALFTHCRLRLLGEAQLPTAVLKSVDPRTESRQWPNQPRASSLLMVFRAQPIASVSVLFVYGPSPYVEQRPHLTQRLLVWREIRRVGGKNSNSAPFPR